MIPQFDLKRQYASIKRDIDAAVGGVMESGKFVLGEQVAAFEEAFARYIGTGYAVGVSSGTDAIMLALKAVGVEEGDEVITVSNTASPTVMAIMNAGAVPVLVDCDGYYNMDVAHVRRAITAKTKAVVPVHLYGQTCDMEELAEMAERHSIALVEDACQAHGAEYKKKKAGSFGIGCFSFYPSKNLGCYGDGGAITTGDSELAEKLKMLRFYGQKSSAYHSLVRGYNARLDELQAAVLRVKLRHLDAWNESRRKKAKLYGELLGGVVEVEVPEEKPGNRHVYHQYVVRAERRDELREFLSANGIGTGIHYPFPIHMQKAFSFLNGAFPVSERNAARIVSLPMFPELGDGEISEVALKMKEFFRKR